MTRPMLRSLVVALLTAGALAFAAPARAGHPVDNLLLAKIIWGMPSERVAQALKLDRSQYTILHNPTDIRITIFQMEGKVLNYPEFRLVFLNFSPEQGLFKVTGVYNGPLTDTVAAMKKRYGDPDSVMRVGTFQHNVWEFDATTLNVTEGEFEITPK